MRPLTAMLRWLPLILVLGVAPPSGALSPADEAGSSAELIERVASALVADGTVRGLSVGFVELDGERVVAHFGEPEGGAVYRIASVSKVFAAMVAADMAAAGDLALDASLSAILPEFRLGAAHPDSPPITLRHLLTHTAGLSRDRLAGMQSHCALGDRYLLEYFAGHAQALPAGYRHSYSNPGFELLGYALEAASGRPLEDLVGERVIRPLGLRATTYDEGKALDLPRALPYAPGDDPPAVELPIRYTAAGGIASSASDLLDVLEMMLDGGRFRGETVLDPAGVAAQLRWQNRGVALDTDVKVGLAWFLEDLPEPYSGRLVHHGGGALYSTAMAMMLPDHGIAVVALAATAGSYGALDGLAREVVFHALERETGQVARRQQPISPGPAEWTAEQRARAQGRFATATDVIEIADRGGALVVRSGGTDRPAHLLEDDWFAYADGFRVQVQLIGGEKVLFLSNPGGVQPIGRELRATAIPASWAQAEGEYRLTGTCPEGETIFYDGIRIRVRGGVLRATLRPGPLPARLLGFPAIEYVLVSRDANTAVMAGFGRYPGEALYLEQGPTGEPQLRFAGLTFTPRP